MNDLFDVAAGSITGRDHVGRGNLLFGKNNQDAFSCNVGRDVIIAVVCDGCSEGVHSEVGARLGAQLLSASIGQRLSLFLRLGHPDFLSDHVVSLVLERTRQDLLAQLRVLAIQMAGTDGSLSHIISEYFLFTTVIAVVTPRSAFIASIGDGVFFLNDEIKYIGPFPGNAPPYVSYALVSSSIDKELLRFTIHTIVPTEDIQTLLIGSDGVKDLVAAAERIVPGKREVVGPVSQFWEQDRYFKPDQIRRRLALINSEVVRRDPESGQLIRETGLLPDDTTLVMIRRKTFLAEGGG